MLQAKESLRHFNCSLHFWTDSRVVLGWITNADLHLARFVKRRVDKIVRVAPASGGTTFIPRRTRPMLVLVVLLAGTQTLYVCGWRDLVACCRNGLTFRPPTRALSFV